MLNSPPDATARLLTDDALLTALASDPLDPADVVDGTPTVSSAELAAVDGVELGLWEISPGVVTDVEADEWFVVLSGRGNVAFDDGSVLAIAPGVVVRLRAGERTTWTVTETIRKVYVLLP